MFSIKCTITICVSQEHRSISRFIGYALCAADEALKDAKWVPDEQEQKERTVTHCYLWLACNGIHSFNSLMMHIFFNMKNTRVSLLAGELEVSLIY